VLRALGRLGTAPALAVVVGALSGDDERARDAACEALARARAESPGVALPDAALVAACEADLARAYAAIAAADGLGRDESALRTDGTRAPVPYRPADLEGPAALISRALRERTERARDRVFLLLGALQPALDVATVRANLHEPDPVRRANAVELLDASDWPGAVAPLKALVVSLVEESTRESRLATARRRLKLPARTRDGWVEALLDDPNAWMVACAAYYAGAAEVLAARPKLAALAADPRAVVRETAADALSRIDDPTRRGPMITTAEKVLFLKGIELFAAVPSEDLVEIAAIAVETAADDEEEIFREGDRGDALYLVVEGTVRVSRGGTALATLGEREVFGEMALLDPGARSATATAATAATLLRVGQDDFAELLRERPEVAVGVLRVLTRRLRAANERLDAKGEAAP
jgi:HEAT repeat protein